MSARDVAFVRFSQTVLLLAQRFLQPLLLPQTRCRHFREDMREDERSAHENAGASHALFLLREANRKPAYGTLFTKHRTSANMMRVQRMRHRTFSRVPGHPSSKR